MTDDLGDGLNPSLADMSDDDLVQAAGAMTRLRYVLPQAGDLLSVSVAVLSRYLTAEASRRGWDPPDSEGAGT